MKILEMYGLYYKMMKYSYGVPDKITVVAVNGDKVTFVRGHHTKEEFLERNPDLDEAIKCMCLTEMQCGSDKIITEQELTEKQKSKIAATDKEIADIIAKENEHLLKFKNGEL